MGALGWRQVCDIYHCCRLFQFDIDHNPLADCRNSVVSVSCQPTVSVAEYPTKAVYSFSCSGPPNAAESVMITRGFQKGTLLFAQPPLFFWQPIATLSHPSVRNRRSYCCDPSYAHEFLRNMVNGGCSTGQMIKFGEYQRRSEVLQPVSPIQP